MTEAIDFAKLNILVIDDQEFVRTIVKKMLIQIGIGKVCEAEDGHSGVATAVREKPDLVICDIQMRPVDGFGFVRTLRGTPGMEKLPVILLTAHTDPATITRAKDLHLRAFLAKPVLPPALKDKIISVLSGGY